MGETLEVYQNHLRQKLTDAYAILSQALSDCYHSAANVSVKWKLVVLSVGGFAAVGALGLYLRRRRKRRRRRDVAVGEDFPCDLSSIEISPGEMYKADYYGYTLPLKEYCSPSVLSGSRGSPSTASSTCASQGQKDECHSLSTATLVNEKEERMTPGLRCEMAVEHIGLAINQWEAALRLIDDMEDDNELSSVSSRLQYQISEYLEMAYEIQKKYQHDHWEHYSAGVALEATLQELDREFEESKKRRRRTGGSSSAASNSDLDSFHSAISVVDLSHVREERGHFLHLPVYEQALLSVEEGAIPYRVIRTILLQCRTDSDFLAKLHCLRTTFTALFSDQSTCDYFVQTGRSVVQQIMEKALKDPVESLTAYDNLISYVLDPDNKQAIEEELLARGVPVVTFYDVVVDFFILDAFDDLSNPPSSVVSVCQNRWLSDSFKETALCTAVWSVLKAKRRMLKFPKGFLAHFYALAEHTSPVFAWGFLGPNSHIKTLCLVFYDQILGFLRDIFNFQHVRYTTYDTMSEDILKLAKDRLKKTLRLMAEVQTPEV